MKLNLTPLQNLTLNMSGGLLPENLQPDEISLLVNECGENWFEDLGYSEPEYKKPRMKEKIKHV